MSTPLTPWAVRMSTPLRPWAARSAAFLVLAGWLSPAFVWLFLPRSAVPPDQQIEAGGAFGIFYFVVVPYLAASLWVMATGLVALIWVRGWSLLLTGLNALGVLCLARWIWTGGDFAPLFRGMPLLETSALTAGVAGAGALLLLALAVVSDAMDMIPAPMVSAAPSPPRPDARTGQG